MRMTRPTSHRESGFTIVEVLVAALVTTMVLAGAMYFIAGAGKSQQRTLVRQRMAATADQISQQVRADRDWLKANPSCKVKECDLSGTFKATPKKGSPTFATDVRIRPVDGEGDGKGSLDEDHIVPDYYRIKVMVSLTDPAQIKEWGAQKAFETVSTIDANAIGRATGSITIQTCAVMNQVDERMSISGCGKGEANMHPMNKQPEPCTNPLPISWDRWVGSRPVLEMGCNDAFNAAGNKSGNMTGVDVRGVTNVSFSITRIGTDGGGTTKRLSTEADSVSSTGEYVFSGLPSGSYKIAVNPGQGREMWMTHTLPSGMTTSVQANQEARAMLMVRPKQGTGSINARFTKQVYLYHLATETGEYSETETTGPVTIKITNHYTYLIAKGPKKETWPGAAWMGILSTEAKPYDRYRSNDETVDQPTLVVPWAPGKDPNNGVITFAGLGTGLYSTPELQANPQPPNHDYWGNPGKRTRNCLGGTPGGGCGNFVWINSNGKADSSFSFHSNDGECYLESNVKFFTFPRKLQLGGGHADRCSRDFIYTNPQTGHKTVIRNFLPDKNGNGGFRTVISSWSESECIAGCEYLLKTHATGSVGYQNPSSSGDHPTTGSSSGPPPTSSNDTVKLPVKPDPPKQESGTPAPSPFGGGGAPTALPAAGAAPSLGSGK